MYEISLKNQICMITGARHGIGRATALMMAEAGLRGITIISTKEDEEAERVEAELAALGTEAMFIFGDASREDTVKQAVDASVDRWKRIDILVNNAGISFAADLDRTTAGQWDRVMDVNIRSVFLTTRYCSRIMRKNGGGSIVNMSSISGITGGNSGPDYGASKAAVIALTKYCARQLGPYGIRVNAVAPGTIDTDMIKRNYNSLNPEQLTQRLKAIPMGRMGTPKEAAKAVLFLASDMGSYVSGAVLEVTGGRMT